MIELFKNYPVLTVCEKDIENAVSLLCKTYEHNGKILSCGNGGSSADCDHITGELMKGFLLKRKKSDELFKNFKALGYDDADYMANHLQGALGAISLPHQSALISAFANDVAADMVYAQLVYGFAQKHDSLICISTSGNSKNVVYAAKTAKMLGITTIALTGKHESKLSELCDVTIRVPECETYRIQELHLPVYHYICAKIENHFFAE